MYKPTGKTYSELAERVRQRVGDLHPAKVEYVDGHVVTTPEIASVELDTQAMPTAVIAAVRDGGQVELPLKVAPKKVPDELLASITDEVSEFSTRFPAYNRPRCSNIRLAAGRLSGHILMPSERLSFNEAVGRRARRN